MFKMTAGAGAKFIPRLGSSYSGGKFNLQFSKWWEKEVIYKDRPSVSLTRKRLVFALRHQDGGGHVGTLTDNAYVRFKAGGGWFGGSGSGPSEPLVGAVAASMRQVAWEITETLKQLDRPLGETKDD
jgi:hypothetical protein